MTFPLPNGIFGTPVPQGTVGEVVELDPEPEAHQADPVIVTDPPLGAGGLPTDPVPFDDLDDEDDEDEPEAHLGPLGGGLTDALGGRIRYFTDSDDDFEALIPDDPFGSARRVPGHEGLFNPDIPFFAVPDAGDAPAQWWDCIPGGLATHLALGGSYLAWRDACPPPRITNHENLRGFPFTAARMREADAAIRLDRDFTGDEAALIRNGWAVSQVNFDIIEWLSCLVWGETAGPIPPRSSGRDLADELRQLIFGVNESALRQTLLGTVSDPVEIRRRGQRGSALMSTRPGRRFIKVFTKSTDFQAMSQAWTAGGKRTRLCAATEVGSTMLHELVHTVDGPWHDHGSSDDVPCATTHLMMHSFQWALGQRYADDLDACCAFYTNGSLATPSALGGNLWMRDRRTSGWSSPCPWPYSGS